MIDKLWQWRQKMITKKVEALNQKDFYWNVPDIGYIVRRFPDDVQSILDVGIGDGWLGAMFKVFRPDIRIYGIEGFKPYCEKAKDYYYHILNHEIISFLPYISNAFDVVICLQTIEHFRQPKKILSELERVAKKAVFVSSVNFFYTQPEYDGNPFQQHESVLPAKYLKKLKYNVRGNGDLTRMFGRVASLFPSLDSGYLAWKIM